MSHRSNQELRKRFLNGNFKVCSSDKLLVLKIMRELAVEVLTLIRQWKPVSQLMTGYPANSVVVNSMKLPLLGIFQSVNKNIKLI